jgi:hypothetical protein
VRFYSSLAGNRPDTSLEIVFISSDRTEKEFKDYAADQPWPAVPFDAKQVKVRRVV